MYESLTSFIPLLKQDNVGKWVVDRENDGTPEHPIQMPFVGYSRLVYDLIDTLYVFGEEHPEYDFRHYENTLKDSGIVIDEKSMKNADISKLDGKSVLALFIGVTRVDRFCEGTLLNFLKAAVLKVVIDNAG